MYVPNKKDLLEILFRPSVSELAHFFKCRISQLRSHWAINEQLLSHLSPLGWEHINLTGDYIWKSNRIPASGKFRRLRPAKVERSKNNLNVQ
nr:Tn3 family transposase [Citrobacter freundii]